MSFFVLLAYNPSNEFTEFRDFISLELCHKYLPDLFSKELILETNRLTEEMIDKARDICKLTKVILSLFSFPYLIKFILASNTTCF
jgi:hypothetical protein